MTKLGCPSGYLMLQTFTCLPYQAWENVHMGLIESVRNGQQPMISSNLDSWLSNLNCECWLMNPENRSTAAAVAHIFEDYLDSNDTVDDNTIEANDI